MKTPTPAQSESVVVSLGTATSSANAAAVASTMQAVVSIVEEAKRELAVHDNILIKARPFTKGSLEIPLELIILSGPTLLAYAPFIEQVLSVLKDYFELRKLLSGETPRSTKGEALLQAAPMQFGSTVVNLFYNSRVNQSVGQAATDVESDEAIEYIKIYKGQDRQVIADVPRTEFSAFQVNPKLAEFTGAERTATEKVTLVIHTPVLQGKGQWTFIFRGKQIKAPIADDRFMRDVLAGQEKFSAGDRLEVMLESHETFNESLFIYQVKRYVIREVLSHVSREQLLGPTLFDS